MEDTLLKKICSNCGTNITLMESCRVTEDANEGVFLVERCLSCGAHPVTEVARLHDDQESLNT